MALHRIPTQTLQDLLSSTYKNNSKSIQCPLPTLNSAYLNNNGFIQSCVYEFNGLNNSGKFQLIQGIIDGMPKKEDILWVSAAKIASRRIPSTVDKFWRCKSWCELYLFFEYVILQEKKYRLIIIEDYYDFIKFEPSTYKQNIQIHKTLKQIHLLANNQQCPLFLLNMISPINIRFIKTELSEESQEFMHQSRENFNKSLINQQILSPYVNHPSWSNYITARFVLYLDWRPDVPKGEAEPCFNIVRYGNMDRVISFEFESGSIGEIQHSLSNDDKTNMSFVVKDNDTEKYDSTTSANNSTVLLPDENLFELDEDLDASIPSLMRNSKVGSEITSNTTSITSITTVDTASSISSAKKLLQEEAPNTENSQDQVNIQLDMDILSVGLVEQDKEITSYEEIQTDNDIESPIEMEHPAGMISSTFQTIETSSEQNEMMDNKTCDDSENVSVTMGITDINIIEKSAINYEGSDAIQGKTSFSMQNPIVAHNLSENNVSSTAMTDSQISESGIDLDESKLPTQSQYEDEEVFSSQDMETSENQITQPALTQPTDKLLALLNDAIEEEDTLTTFMTEINETVNNQMRCNTNTVNISGSLETIENKLSQSNNESPISEASSPNYNVLDTPSPAQFLPEKADLYTNQLQQQTICITEEQERTDKEFAEESGDEIEELYPTQPESLSSFQMSQIPSIKRHSSSLGIRRILNKRQRLLREMVLNGNSNETDVADLINIGAQVTQELDSNVVMESQPYF